MILELCVGKVNKKMRKQMNGIVFIFVLIRIPPIHEIIIIDYLL
jgi:hypothetical protein